MTACVKIFLVAAIACSLSSFESSLSGTVEAPARSVAEESDLPVWSDLSLKDCCTPIDEFQQNLSLACLTIEGYGSNHDLPKWLAAQCGVRELSLICLALGETEVKAIACLPSLERLDLRGCVISIENLHVNCDMTTLQQILLGSATIGIESRTDLESQFPCLIVLTDDN